MSRELSCSVTAATLGGEREDALHRVLYRCGVSGAVASRLLSVEGRCLLLFDTPSPFI